MLPTNRNDNNEIAEASGIRMIHPGSRQLFRYWEALRAERPCPSRNEIDLAQIANLLPHVTVIERQGFNLWRHRMAGSNVCELLCEQVTGRSVLTGFDRSAHEALAGILQVAVTKLQPAIIRLRLIGAHHTMPAEMLVLPTRDAKGETVQLFCSLFGFNTEEAVSSEPLLRRELLSARLIWTEHGEMQGQPALRETTPFTVIQGGRVH